MTKRKNMKTVHVLIYMLSISLFSCNEGFLDVKPDRSLVVPQTLEDLNAILNNQTLMLYNTPFLPELAGDDFFVEEQSLRNASPVIRNSYLWQVNDFYEDFTISSAEWSRNYERIYYANNVLEFLNNMQKTDENTWNRLYGTALFYRALGHYSVAQMFSQHFVEEEAAESEGIPLHLTSNVNDRPKRGSLLDTYQQIIKDLRQSEVLVPDLYTENKSSPDRLAVWGLLARIYLSIEDYDSALSYANLVLSQNNQLMNFNSLDSTLQKPIPYGFYPYDSKNVEVIMFLSEVNYGMNITGTSTIFVHPNLFGKYDEEDLRRNYYFTHVRDSLYAFSNPYNGTRYWFSGLTTSEMYLIRMESNVRLGNVQEAVTDFNWFMKHRMKSSFFDEYRSSDSDELLDLILLERRKELIGRGLRWTDLRRLNRESNLKKLIVHHYEDQEYIIDPSSPNYVFPIHPLDVDLGGL